MLNLWATIEPLNQWLQVSVEEHVLAKAIVSAQGVHPTVRPVVSRYRDVPQVPGSGRGRRQPGRSGPWTEARGCAERDGDVQTRFHQASPESQSSGPRASP